VVQLTRSYRYAAASGIDLLARAVQAGDMGRALKVLDDLRYPEVALDESDPLAAASNFACAAITGYRPYLEARAEPARALALFDRFRVLTAHRQGERGVEALNRKLARWLYEASLIERSDGNYAGRPIIITENDYRTQLWNGDVGILGAGTRSPRVAWFQAPDASLRELSLGSLPPHESAFVLSVHKSQGSEVDDVSLVLPVEPSRLLSRELLYTAITRARRSVVIYGSRAVFSHAIARAITRSTGLRDLLEA
jgi:exodeoxyribonuclease V alpha subunit